MSQTLHSSITGRRFDADLFAAQTGVPGAGDRFVRSHREWIVAAARRIAAKLEVPRSELDDLVQEVFLAIFDPRVQRFRAAGRSAGKAYVRGLIYNAVCGTRRDRRRAIEVRYPDALELGPMTSTAADMARVEAFVDAAVMVSKADPLELTALELMFVDDLSGRGAAARLGLTPATLCRRLQRLYQAMREAA